MTRRQTSLRPEEGGKFHKPVAGKTLPVLPTLKVGDVVYIMPGTFRKWNENFRTVMSGVVEKVGEDVPNHARISVQTRADTAGRHRCWLPLEHLRLIPPAPPMMLTLKQPIDRVGLEKVKKEFFAAIPSVDGEWLAFGGPTGARAEVLGNGPVDLRCKPFPETPAVVQPMRTVKTMIELGSMPASEKRHGMLVFCVQGGDVWECGKDLYWRVHGKGAVELRIVPVEPAKELTNEDFCAMFGVDQ